MALSGGLLCHVQRNLACLRELPRVSLANIKNFDGAKKKKQRKGRGPGSGRGKTSGRGHKGQGQRNTLPYLGFEGGQTPFYLLVPKHGRKNKNARQYTGLHLHRIQYFVDSGRLPINEKITIRTLMEHGLVTKLKDGLKLLGGGADWFQAKIDIEVTLASKEAIRAIERQGGKVTLAYHDRASLERLVRPYAYPDELLPREAKPFDKWLYFYSNPERRGYLADPELVEAERAKNRVVNDLSDEVKKLDLGDK